MIHRILKRLRRTASSPTADDQLRLVNADGQPNINDLWRATKDIEALKLSVKSLGYELARSMETKLQGQPVGPAHRVGLDSKPVTQNDIESRWFRGWCAEMLERPRYHRRLWEAAYLLQALFDAGALKPQARLLSLAGGRETVASYLALKDTRQVVVGSPVLQTREHLVDQTVFNQSVQARDIGLEALPADLTGFDGCWSMGAANGMGSIQKGIDLILAAMDTLKPGGLAVHMLEFNFADDEQTIDNWPSVMFQRRHIEQLWAALKDAGHAPARLDFHVGHQPLDRFIDIPPFETDRTKTFDRLWRDGWQGAHLKASIDGFATTSFGLIVTRGG